MAKGHMENGKFIPHNNNSDGVSSDQVEQKEPEPQINQNDIEKLKKRNLD